MFSMPMSKKAMMPVMGIVSHWHSSHNAQGRNISHMIMNREVCLFSAHTMTMIIQLTRHKSEHSNSSYDSYDDVGPDPKNCTQYNSH